MGITHVQRLERAQQYQKKVVKKWQGKIEI